MIPTSNQTRTIFLEALELSAPERRAAYLEQACRGDPDLRVRVERLLRSHNLLGSFHENSLPDTAANARPVSEQPGDAIGPYKLLQQLGEGGMGVVFKAEQTRPVERTVAVKIIKPGMDTRQVIARFEAERQTLAMMDHPNIARVVDAGTTDTGRPYFVMDLVKGVLITDYCDRQHLSIRARLELVIQVCHAVQHAHQKGIIHRDLKPSNVLVAAYDGKPVPKVIDFGVAKATTPQLTQRTMCTEYGQLIGTIEYMSPEQARFNQLDVDTRSDIYSLGVLLYELLTGETPFDRKRLHDVSFDEALRIIREEEPPRPSTRVTTVAQHACSTISAQLDSDTRRLNSQLRGELDWIVMKCLEKDRNRRYDSANSLAADIERYLRDEPVQACPPSVTYRLGKFLRRHQAAFIAGAAVALAALVAVGSLISGVHVLATSHAQVNQEQKQTAEALQRERESSYVHRIALAERELAGGNVGRAEELLAQCPRDRRGWEWHFLRRQRYGNSPPLRHTATVVRAAFSPDGLQLAVACMDGTIAIRDAHTGQLLHALEKQSVLLGGALVRGMAFSPDAKRLAVARNDGKICIWDAIAGELLNTLDAHQGPAWQAVFSPDSQSLATCGSDRNVRVWNVASGRPLQTLSNHPAAVKGVAFRLDGRTVVAACDDGTVKVWDWPTGNESFSFCDKLLTYPWSPWFSADAQRLAWACLDGVIKIWDTTTGRLEIDQQSNTHQCRAVAFSPDGKRIAVAGFDGTIRLLDAVTGREMLTIFAHPSLVAGVTFSLDGHRLASSSYDHTVRVWDATPLTTDPLAPHCITLGGHQDKVAGVAFSPDGRWLASGSWDHTIKVWEFSHNDERQTTSLLEKSAASALGTITLRHTLRGHRGVVTGVVFFPDSRILASAGWDNTVKLWDLEASGSGALTELRSIPLTQRLNDIAINPDGRLLAVGQESGIVLLDPVTGKSVYPFKKTPAPVPSLAFHPYMPLLISTGASDPAVKIWALEKEDFRFEIRHNSNPNPCVAISPDGQRLASPVRDRANHTVRVWDVDWKTETFQEFRTLRGHRGYVWRVAFSPDGRYVASGSWDSTVKIWDLDASASAEPITLRGHAGFIQSLAFSPHEGHLATGSGYVGRGEIMVWDAALWRNARGEQQIATSSSTK